MNNSSCFDGLLDVYKAYAVLNMLLGLAACISGISVLIILFLLDKHLFYYQRLIMYLNVTVVFGGLVSLISFNPFLGVDGELTNSIYCTVNGILFNWSELIQCVMIWWISVEVFRLAYVTDYRPNKVSIVEIVALLATFFIPLALVWVPALPSIDLYGPDGPLCDIQIFSYSTCQKIPLGYALQGVYRLVPLAVSAIVLPFLVVINLCKIKRSTGTQGSNSHQQHEIADIRRTALQLQAYPIIFVVSSIAPALYFAFDPNEHYTGKYLVYFLYIIINNFRGITVSLMSAFDRDTRYRLCKVSIPLVFQRLTRKDPVLYNVSSLYTSYGDSLDANELKAIKRHDLETQLI